MTHAKQIHWFLAGAAAGVTLGALGARVAMGSAPNIPTAVTTQSPATTAGLLMPGDSWPTTTELGAVGRAERTGNSDVLQHGNATGNAGSLEQVTRNLAQRLAAKGGTAAEWRLLAQSYDYLGRTDAARAARRHLLNE